MSIAEEYQQQHFANGYRLADGVALHKQNGDRFQIPHAVLKKHVRTGHFLELRIDSDRFSVHPDAPEKCACPSCNGEATNPVLCHEQPHSLMPRPEQDAPSRGWGEDFWVKIDQREGDVFRATVDNRLVESRLHKIDLGAAIWFESRHILAVHPMHRQELVKGMDEHDIRQLVDWLGLQR